MVQWRRDGRELYYLDRDGNVMAVDVSTSSSFQAGSPKRLFRLPDTFPLNRTNYADCSCALAGGCEQGHISRDGEKFIFSVPLPPTRQEVSVTTETLSRYAGVYTLGRRGCQADPRRKQPCLRWRWNQSTLVRRVGTQVLSEGNQRRD